MLRGQATMSPTVTATERSCLTAKKELAFMLRKCYSNNKVNLQAVQKLNQLIACHGTWMSALRNAGNTDAEVSSENLAAAFVLVADAKQVALENDLVNFVTLGLGQMFRVMQGRQVQSMVIHECNPAAVCYPVALGLQEFMQDLMHLLQEKEEGKHAEVKKAIAETSKAKNVEVKKAVAETIKAYEVKAAENAQAFAKEMEDLSGCNKLHMSLFHETSLREIAQLRRNFAHVREACALKRELASQQRQNADTLQQLSALQEEKSFLVDEVVDVQAQSTSLEAQVSAEKETSRKLKEHSQTLEAELLVETERALSAEEEADCLEVELVEAKAKADTSQEHLRADQECEDLRQALDAKEQEASNLSQDLADANDAYDEVFQCWEEQKQARETAESEVASLQQQLEQAGEAERVAVATFKLEAMQVKLRLNTLLQECHTQLAAEKETHVALAFAQLEAAQRITDLQTELEGMQQELADEKLSCIAATDRAASVEAELEAAGRSASFLQTQLTAAHQDLAAEQQRHETTKETAGGLQSQLQDVRQELIAEQQKLMNAVIQKEAAEQSVSSLHVRLEVTRQLLADQKQAHEAAIADLRGEGQASQHSLHSQLESSEQAVAALKILLDAHELRSRKECMTDVSEAEDTVAALQIARHAALKKCRDDEAAFQQSLHGAHQELQAVSAKSNKLAEELGIRDSTLSDCRAMNIHLVEEIVSYRAQVHEMNGTFAAFTEQFEAQNSRADSQEQQSMSQEATIQALHRELHCFRARSTRIPPHNAQRPMEGPPRHYPHHFPQSHDPAVSMESDSGHVCVSGSMQGYGAAQLPTENPQPAGATTQASDDCRQALATSANVMQSEAEPSPEVSFCRLNESLGATLLAKLQKKDVSDSTAKAEGATLAAPHSDPTLTPCTAPSPPLQASRRHTAEGAFLVAETASLSENATAEITAWEGVDAAGGIAEAAGVHHVPQATAAAHAPAAAEAQESRPPPPARRVVYVTPLPPAQLATMTDEEQHSYRDALDKVSRCPPTTSLAPALTGTPVPSRQTLVEPALVDEVSRSPAKCDATHTDSKSPGTNMLPDATTPQEQAPAGEGDVKGVQAAAALSDSQAMQVQPASEVSDIVEVLQTGSAGSSWLNGSDDMELYSTAEVMQLVSDYYQDGT